MYLSNRNFLNTEKVDICTASVCDKSSTTLMKLSIALLVLNMNVV